MGYLYNNEIVKQTQDKYYRDFGNPKWNGNCTGQYCNDHF